MVIAPIYWSTASFNTVLSNKVINITLDLIDLLNITPDFIGLLYLNINSPVTDFRPFLCAI